jgi:hypothetical protein
MPTSTYTPLANVTLASSASSVTFSSIPATYRDLILVSSIRTGTTTDNVLRLNGDTGSNYSTNVMYGDGSNAFSAAATWAYGFFSYSNSTNPEANITQFLDYSATDKHKTFLSKQGAAANLVGARVGRWASTNAITTIQLNAGIVATTTFTSGSTFSLYGVIA